MCKLKIKNKIRNTIILALLCTGLGFFIAPSNNIRFQDVFKLNKPKEVVTKDAIVGKIQEKQELITLEVDLSQSMTIDDSWGTLEIFKKMSKINYAGKGTYILPLSEIKAENINITGKNISIKIPEPSAKAVTIDEDKTTFDETEKGLLRFGDIKLTPIENQEITKTVKEKMLGKMKESELYSKAKESSKKAVLELVKTVLSDKVYSQYGIEVKY